MSILRRSPDLRPRIPSATNHAEEAGILRNLGHLLQSKRDYASFLPQFGLGETFHRPVTPATIELLRREIISLVTLYEPRLHDPKVITLPRAADGTLRFRLSGQLAGGRPLQLVAELSPSCSRVTLAEPGASR